MYRLVGLETSRWEEDAEDVGMGLHVGLAEGKNNLSWLDERVEWCEMDWARGKTKNKNIVFVHSRSSNQLACSRINRYCVQNQMSSSA